MVIGIDFGSSMTKFVVVENGTIIHQSRIPHSEDYMEYLKQLHPEKASKIMICGAGASFIDNNILDIPTEHVTEFDALAYGGRHLSGLDECLVIGLGTGTSFLYVNSEKEVHLGGSGIGGALLTTLAKNCCGYTDIEAFLDLAAKGDLSKADLQIRDISKTDIDNLYADATAANMAKLNENSSLSDYATGICNLVFQNVGVMAYLADGAYHTGHAVVIGTLASCEAARRFLGLVTDLFHIEFILPDNASYGVAIGAALLGER